MSAASLEDGSWNWKERKGTNHWGNGVAIHGRTSPRIGHKLAAG
jgi:hypothetical protein